MILFLISALSSFYFCVLLCFGQSSGCSQVNLFFSLYVSAVRGRWGIAVTLQGDVENQVCECDTLKIDNSNRHHGCVYFDEFKPDFDIKVRGRRSCGCDNMETKKRA